MTTTLDERQLKTLVKESVKEAFRTELMNLFLQKIPFVSRKEQREIERIYKKPTRKIVKTRTVTI